MIQVALMGFVCFAAGQATPAKPPSDFSGTWTLTSLVVDPKPGSGGSAALPPSDLVIRQTASVMEIDETLFGTVRTQRFALDGTESVNKSGASVLASRTRWVGSMLVTEGKVSQVTSAGYDEWTLTETRSLTPAGGMVIETRYTSHDGRTTSSTRQFRKR
jgi:hypothetical protein